MTQFARFVKCLRCHTKTLVPFDVTKLEQCPNCKERNFLTYYEHTNGSEVKGGNEEMAKEKEVVKTETKAKKDKKDKAPSFVTRVAELMKTNTPEEIKEIISKDRKCTLGGVKATIKYIESKTK